MIKYILRMIVSTVAILLTSCTTEYVRNGDSTYASTRLGTNTAYRHVTNGTFSSTVVGENNGDAFREATSLGKFITVASAINKLAKTTADTVEATQLSADATTQALATQKSLAARAASEAAARTAEAAASVVVP